MWWRSETTKAAVVDTQACNASPQALTDKVLEHHEAIEALDVRLVGVGQRQATLEQRIAELEKPKKRARPAAARNSRASGGAGKKRSSRATAPSSNDGAAATGAPAVSKQTPNYHGPSDGSDGDDKEEEARSSFGLIIIIHRADANAARACALRPDEHVSRRAQCSSRGIV